jgi:hypothetical protein
MIEFFSTWYGGTIAIIALCIVSLVLWIFRGALKMAADGIGLAVKYMVIWALHGLQWFFIALWWVVHLIAVYILWCGIRACIWGRE